MARDIRIRPYEAGDEAELSGVIRHTLRVSNSGEYSAAYIEESVRSHTPEAIAAQAGEAHFHVACEGEKIIGCGAITGYWGSETESYIMSVFVLPEYQGRGIGRRIMETLEGDPYFARARRTEVGSSLNAVGFYRRLGYTYKNGVTEPDEYQVVRLEKRKRQAREADGEI